MSETCTSETIAPVLDRQSIIQRNAARLAEFERSFGVGAQELFEWHTMNIRARGVGQQSMGAMHACYKALVKKGLSERKIAELMGLPKTSLRREIGLRLKSRDPRMQNIRERSGFVDDAPKTYAIDLTTIPELEPYAELVRDYAYLEELYGEKGKVDCLATASSTKDVVENDKYVDHEDVIDVLRYVEAATRLAIDSHASKSVLFAQDVDAILSAFSAWNQIDRSVRSIMQKPCFDDEHVLTRWEKIADDLFSALTSFVDEDGRHSGIIESLKVSVQNMCNDIELAKDFASRSSN